MSPEADKYTYPNGVLRNLLGIEDEKKLDQALNSYATRRMYGVLADGLPERPDFDYLRSIHQRLFQDTLPFAGQLRDVDAQAQGVLAYCRPAFIRPELDTLYRRLKATDYLRGMNKQQFSSELAERWGDLTMIHPFRDGITRSQSLYIHAMSARAGYQIQWDRANVDHLRAARLHAAAGNPGYLAEWIKDHVQPVSGGSDLHQVFARSRLSFPHRGNSPGPTGRSGPAHPTRSRMQSRSHDQGRGIE